MGHIHKHQQAPPQHTIITPLCSQHCIDTQGQMAARKQDAGVVTILCIDGGGIRGLIPATVLDYLEQELQTIEKSTEVRLADYFDYIVGTSTGALVTTMLTTPNEDKRPLLTAKEIIQLYMDEGPGIFRNDNHASWEELLVEAALVYIKFYNGDNEVLKTLRLLLDATGMKIEDLVQPLLDAIRRAIGGEPAAPSAAADSDDDVHLVAGDGTLMNGAIILADSGFPKKTIKDWFHQLLAAALQALGQGLESLESGLQDGIDELEKALSLLTPDNIRYALLRPKYDGKGLRRVIKTKLRARPKLQETLTNVVVPTFDVKQNKPVIFSTSQARKGSAMDPYLSDLCIAATAAPTFFPAHGFKTPGPWLLETTEFNLMDAGIFANNPTMVAMNEIWRTVDRHETLPVEDVSPMDCTNLCILSLGTGVVNHSYTAEECSWWGVIPWMYNLRHNTTPLIDMLTGSAGDLVDYNVALLFKSQNCEDNYLRIQEANLDVAVGAMDDTSNMAKLKKIGENLLDRQVHRTDWETREYKPVDGAGTNKQALTNLAHRLIAERNRRNGAATARQHNVTEPRPKKIKITHY